MVCANVKNNNNKIIIFLRPIRWQVRISPLFLTIATTPPSLSPSEQHYVDNSRTMLSLATMSIGARDEDGLPLIDCDLVPWNKMPRKQIKPGSDLLRAEIKRRWQAELPPKDKEPSSKNWDKTKLMKWLEEHPIIAAEDAAFLKQAVASRKRTAVNAARETEFEREQLLAVDVAGKKYKKCCLQ